MRLMLRQLPAASALLLMPLAVSGCASLAASPPLADLNAVTEPKPIPGDEIASDPVAEAHYNAALESWGDRLHGAGARLCRFFERTGMQGLNCPPAAQAGAQ